jgi:hypothetical protein
MRFKTAASNAGVTLLIFGMGYAIARRYFLDGFNAGWEAHKKHVRVSEYNLWT